MKETTSNSSFRFVPNCITTIGLLCGLIAIVFSFECREEIGGFEGYKWVWIFICGAIICDFCDGLCARVLDAYSDLGKNLDSLSDLVSFGLAPCFLIFNLVASSQQELSFVTWLPLLIPLTGAYRLARFNIDPGQKTVFRGLPIPANAIFWVGFSTLLVISEGIPVWILISAIIVISSLMVIPIPMFSMKISRFTFDTENIMRTVLIVATILSIIFLGVQGLMWTIIVYLLLCFYKTVFLQND